jgi:TonB family protein
MKALRTVALVSALAGMGHATSAGDRWTPEVRRDPSIFARVVENPDEPARFLKKAPVQYPPEAFRQGREGTVVLDIVVDENGRVAWWGIVESAPEFNEAAIRSVRRTLYAPARRGGVPVASRMSVPIRFQVRKF